MSWCVYRDKLGFHDIVPVLLFCMRTYTYVRFVLALLQWRRLRQQIPSLL